VPGDAEVDAFVEQVVGAYPRLDLERALPESLVAL